MENQKHHGRHVLTLIILIVILAVISAGVWYVYATKAKDKSSKKVVTLTIKPGTGSSMIASQLKKANLIRSAAAFKIYSKINGTEAKYQAGTYGLQKSMPVSEIAKIIETGKTNSINVTIPEGLTEYQVAARFANAGLVKEDDFKKALESGNFKNSYSFLKNAQSGKHRLEGYLFPDTYAITPGSSAEDIITMMLNRTQEELNNIGTSDLPEGYSLNEVMVVASIVEKESQVDKDRSKIASVIYNRLKKDMPLQMDSTITYLLDQTGKHKTSVSYADLKIDSPYNTYKNTGLPPGPIASPGASSIKAAMHPADTDYLYFVVSSKLDGSHVFSNSYKQFEKDKDAYSAALKKQNK